MSETNKGWIIRSTAGHDKNQLFCVVGTEEGFLLLANGKQRKLAAPKRKKCKHTQTLSQGDFNHPAIQAIKSSESVSDKALRMALAAFEGGNHAWQKTI